MTLAQRAVRGAATVLVSSYANMAFGIAYGIVLARILRPDDFGVFAGAMFVVSLIDIRGKLGFDSAFLHRQPTTEALLATHWLLQMAAGLAPLAAAVVAALLVTRFQYPPETGLLLAALGGALLLEAGGTTARAELEKVLGVRTSGDVAPVLFDVVDQYRMAVRAT